jgi:hypothetical protein
MQHSKKLFIAAALAAGLTVSGAAAQEMPAPGKALPAGWELTPLSDAEAEATVGTGRRAQICMWLACSIIRLSNGYGTLAPWPRSASGWNQHTLRNELLLR